MITGQKKGGNIIETRKLASVQIITELSPIPDADKIEMAKVLGWHVVVKKGEFQVGDKVVYLEIDSIPPADNPDFAFLLNSKGKMKPLKTKKIRGAISQGLVMPLSVLHYESNVEEGQDVTDVLGVVKKEDEVIEFYKSMGAVKKRDFPPFLHKTDETRVQVLQKHLNVCQGHKFVATEKVDGTSFTAFIREGKFGICSRNMEVDLEMDSPYASIAFKYMLKEKFEKLREKYIPYDFAIQGEIIGANIQKNKYHVADYECYLFNYVNIDKQKDIGFFFSDEAEQQEFEGINLASIAELLGMKTVPVIDEDFTMINDIDTLVDLSVGDSVLYPKQTREGLVFRAKHNKELSYYGERISFKAINPNFLLQS